MAAIERVLYPRSVEEALSLLADPELGARPLAGGTSAARRVAPGTRTLVDITRIGLDAIEPDGDELVVGAAVRAQALAESEAVAGLYGGVLATAAGHVGSRLIRNAATVGGNLVQLYPWSDLPVALLALDAVVEIRGTTTRRVPIATLLETHPQKQLGPDELVTAVRLRRPALRQGGAYIKEARTRVDDALATVAVAVTLDDAGRCATARIALGAVQPRPAAATAAARLVGTAPGEDDFRAVAAAVREEVPPVTDRRAGEAYRATLVDVIVRRALAASFAQASGEERP